jgi:DNA recombination protein Rad52
MAFSDSQIGALESRLRVRHVCERDEDGRLVSYVEGWHVIEEANRIFGFDAWDRELVRTECVWQGRERNLEAVSYVVTVRIRVFAGDRVVMRDGTGYGYGTGTVPGAAHEKAAKQAETDAMKRAFVTFGNPFGLALYDPQQRGTTRRRKPPVRATVWTLRSGNGQTITRHKDPVAFTKELLQLIQLAASPKALEELWRHNRSEVHRLRRLVPVLCDRNGRHYSDGLTETFKERLDNHVVESPTHKADTAVDAGDRGQESAKSAGKPTRRVRDKKHIAFVAQQPCAICGRSPAQSHHLRHAQPRAMGLKVSDEYVVPLCNIHHRSLHDAGNEERWWIDQKQEPLALASELWARSHGHDRAPSDES